MQHEKPKRKRTPPPPNISKELPPRAVPPLYTTLTSSPNVYVAMCACEEFDIEPKSLFEDTEIPDSFRYSQFDYCSPSRFPNHEMPGYNIPEVAILGRSNVGKSSLVNAIMRHNLARCSKTPGRTQMVNYFPMIPTHRFDKEWEPHMAHGFIVDLPGYGYAQAPVTAVKDWQAKTQDFLLARRDHGTLRRLFILIDARRGPTQFDRDIMGWFDEADIAYSVVITKSDRVVKPLIVRYANEVCMRYHSQLYGSNGQVGCQGPVVHVTSAKDGIGVLEMQSAIAAEFAGYYAPVEASAQREEDDESYLEGDDEYEERDYGIYSQNGEDESGQSHTPGNDNDADDGDEKPNHSNPQENLRPSPSHGGW
jgi:GTP-binding protein